MQCYHPLTAFKSKEVKKNGKHSIYFSDNTGEYLPIQLPCGQCIGCRIEYSRQWAVRGYHEAQRHDENCFITLTYNDENLPYDGSLHISDWQKFVKKLRNHFSDRKINPATGRRKRYYKKFKYLHCGEYGDLNLRPHYHACLFGIEFDDLELHHIENGQRVYTSETLSKIWGKGFVTVGTVTFESIAYVARYVLKKMTGEKAEEHYYRPSPFGDTMFDVLPEYMTSSRRPGIAKEWFDEFLEDVYPYDEVIINKRAVKPPRYYDNLLEKYEPDMYQEIKDKRIENALLREDDNTAERLAVKEKIKLNKLKQLPRKL